MPEFKHTFVVSIEAGPSVKLQTTHDGEIHIDGVQVTDDADLSQKLSLAAKLEATVAAASAVKAEANAALAVAQQAVSEASAAASQKAADEAALLAAKAAEDAEKMQAESADIS